MEPTKEMDEMNTSSQPEKVEETVGTKAEEIVSQSDVKADDVAATAEPKAEEAVTEEAATEEAKPEKTPEEIAEAKAKRSKNIKLGIIGVGGAFILIAFIYFAAVMGGKNTTIEKEEKPVAEVVEEEEEDDIAVPTPTVEVEDEEDTPDDSVVGVVFGNARYDDCLYADGGVIIVKKNEKYGAINYEGKEIVPLKYDALEEMPTKEGMFVLSNIKSADETYTLFDNKGKALYEGTNRVLASNNTYVLYIEDASGGRETRVEYHKIGTKDKPYTTLYVNDQFTLNGFMDGKTIAMGFTAIPTEDQDSNPTNLFCGIMDESGKTEWFAKAPGVDEFDSEMKIWEEEKKLEEANKKNKKSTKKKNKKTDEQLLDEDGNPIEDADEADDEELEEIKKLLEEVDLDENLTDEEKELKKKEIQEKANEKKELEEDELTEDSEEDELTEDLEDDELTDDLEDDELADSDKPVFHMKEVLSAPVGGYFIYKDKYDVKDSYSWYTDKGVWYADLDLAFLEKDDKKGFRVGNFNDGAVEPKTYLFDGEYYYNFGSLMVLTVGDKNVLIDMSKGKGMKAENVSNKIVLAVYDEICMDENNYWMYRDGDKYGYMDQKGKAQKVVFEGATPFVNGYALVIKNKQAILINEKFEEIEILDDATEVSVSGDILNITGDEGIRRYMVKEIRDNGGEEKAAADATPDAKATPSADATPEAKTGKKKK